MNLTSLITKSDTSELGGPSADRWAEIFKEARRRSVTPKDRATRRAKGRVARRSRRVNRLRQK